MQRFFKSAAIVSAVSVIGCTLFLVSPKTASAQPKGMNGSYIGIGGGSNGNIGFGSVTGRINFGQISVRPKKLYNIIQG